MIVKCYLCQNDKQCGDHVYEGRGVPARVIWICRTCRKVNHDGVDPSHHHGERLVKFLEENGIPYELNADGWIDIPQ